MDASCRPRDAHHLMLKISREQIKGIRREMLHALALRMAVDIAERTPAFRAIYGEVTLQAAVQQAAEHAVNYGFEAEPAIELYVKTTLLIGNDFPTDPQVPWAAKILADAHAGGPSRKAERIYERADSLVARIFGHREEHLRESLLILERPWIERELSARSTETELLRLLIRLQPRRSEAIGEEALRCLIAEGRANALGYGLMLRDGVAIYIALQFLFGANFATSETLPWAGCILRDRALVDEHDRVVRLLAAAMDHRARWLAYANRGSG